jgi:hypothetical protein
MSPPFKSTDRCMKQGPVLLKKSGGKTINSWGLPRAHLEEGRLHFLCYISSIQLLPHLGRHLKGNQLAYQIQLQILLGCKQRAIESTAIASRPSCSVSSDPSAHFKALIQLVRPRALAFAWKKPVFQSSDFSQSALDHCLSISSSLAKTSTSSRINPCSRVVGPRYRV